MKYSTKLIGGFLLVALLSVQIGFAKPASMHILEGFLPAGWAVFWYVLCVPFWILSYRKLKTIWQENPRERMLVALSTAFAFVLSALKFPSVTGSSSHPTGTGLGGMMFGGLMMPILGTVVLIFQTLLLAHGGITTLGANAFAFAVVGPLVAYALYTAMRTAKLPLWFAVFIAATTADIATYTTTAIQLALAFPGVGFVNSLTKFLTVFGLTQIPLAISEGLLTVLIVQALVKQSPEAAKRFDVKSYEMKKSIPAWLIWIVVIVMAITPILIIRDSEFAGADGQAADLIGQIAPEYVNWFEPIWSPGTETESFLFSLQAAIGAGIIGYFFGTRRGSNKTDKTQ